MNKNKKLFFKFVPIIAIFLGLSLFVTNLKISTTHDLVYQSLTFNNQNNSEKTLFQFSNNKFEINYTNSLNNQAFQEKPQNQLAITTQDKQSLKIISSEDEDYNPESANIVYTPTSIKQANFENSKTFSDTEINSQPLDTVGFLSTSIANNAQNVSVNAPFSVTFNSPVSPSTIQNLRFYPTAEFTTSQNGQTVTIYPKRLQKLTNYVFGTKIGMGLCAGIACSSEAVKWDYALSFKTDFKEVYTYGYSILGRPLTAYIYGQSDDLGKKILLTSGTHGEEYQAGGLWKFVDEINVNPQWIVGKNKTLLIVPRVNPDGTAIQEADRKFSQKARYNARGVNLNRSYPAQWQPCASCGPFPASEPETYNLINLVNSEKVNHMIAYHSQWPPNGIIFLGADGHQYTIDWSYWVSNRTGYPVGIYNGPEVAGGGDVPGDQAVWGESVGVNSLLIEATYRGVDDYGKNRNMYLALLSEDDYTAP